MPKRIADLSARSVDALKETGRHAVGPAGLYLVIRDGGARAWSFLYMRAGQRREMSLGPAGAGGLSLKQARDAVAAHRLTLASGADPVAARKAARVPDEIPTFAAMAADLMASIEGGFRNEKHKWQWRHTLATYAKPLARKPVDAINTDDVLAVLKPIWLAKPETASRLRGRIERVLDAAKAKGFRTGENPAAWRGHLALLLPKRQRLTRGHHAAMPYADVPAFLAALATRDALAALALRFTILTAARSGETLGATWREIDLEARVWNLPGHRMKAGVPHVVPLSDAAMALLAEAGKAGRSPDALIFPGGNGGKPLSGMAMAMLLRRMGEAVTVHGFRSSFRDWAGDDTPFPREVAEAALAHRVGDAVERAYRRGDALEKRRALMAAWGDFLIGSRARNVVMFNGGHAA